MMVQDKVPRGFLRYQCFIPSHFCVVSSEVIARLIEEFHPKRSCFVKSDELTSKSEVFMFQSAAAGASENVFVLHSAQELLDFMDQQKAEIET